MIRRKIVALTAGLLALSQLTAAAQTSATWTSGGQTGSQYYARSGDFTGDGRTDIASPVGLSLVRMKVNTGSSFTAQDWPFTNTSQSVLPSDSAQWFAGDFTCDGRTDFVVFGQQATVYENNSLNGSNSFTAVGYSFGGPLSQIDYSRTRVGDFDGDNCNDIFVVHTGGSAVTVLQKGFQKTFNKWFMSINSSWGADHTTLMGDFDCDGRKDDFASFNGGSVYMKYFDQTTTSFVNMTGANPSPTWGWGGYAESGKFTTVAPGFNLADCSWDVAIPWGSTVLIKVNDQQGFVDETVNSPSWSTGSWAVTNAWNSQEWTFPGRFNEDDRVDFASLTGSSTAHMKFAP
jgi:hypothetical protein